MVQSIQVFSVLDATQPQSAAQIDAMWTGSILQSAITILSGENVTVEPEGTLRTSKSLAASSTITLKTLVKPVFAEESTVDEQDEVSEKVLSSMYHPAFKATIEGLLKTSTNTVVSTVISVEPAVALGKPDVSADIQIAAATNDNYLDLSEDISARTFQYRVYKVIAIKPILASAVTTRQYLVGPSTSIIKRPGQTQTIARTIDIQLSGPGRFTLGIYPPPRPIGRFRLSTAQTIDGQTRTEVADGATLDVDITRAGVSVGILSVYGAMTVADTMVTAISTFDNATNSYVTQEAALGSSSVPYGGKIRQLFEPRTNPFNGAIVPSVGELTLTNDTGNTIASGTVVAEIYVRTRITLR